MATAALHYTAAALTDRGRKRSSNEDAFVCSSERGVYLVCDGMGGVAGGEIASSLAVEEMVSRLAKRDSQAGLPAAATEAVQAANQAIFSRAQRNPNLRGMGTTLVGLLTDGRQAWVINIGDSRCYRQRDSHLEQITLDHSLVEEQVRAGQMTAAEAARSPYRNMITRALGTYSQITADIFALEPAAGDIFLLCSDGLTRELADEQIASLLDSDAPLEDLCARLVAEANKAGGHDNITCILVRATALA